MKTAYKRNFLFALAIVTVALAPAGSRFHVAEAAAPQAAQAETERPLVVEYYYKAKWGHADEFISLFRKNHYPVLKKEAEMGRMLKVSAVSPFYHTTEDGRWDYRVTIVYKNATIAHDGFDSGPLIKQLFPDQETY